MPSYKSNSYLKIICIFASKNSDKFHKCYASNIESESSIGIHSTIGVVSKRKQDGVRVFVFCKSLVFMVLSKHGQTAQTTLHLPLQLLNFTNKVVSHIQTPNSFNTIDYLTLLPTPFQQQLYSSSFLFRSHLYTSENDITFLCGIKYVLLKLFQLTS